MAESLCHDRIHLLVFSFFFNLILASVKYLPGTTHCKDTENLCIFWGDFGNVKYGETENGKITRQQRKIRKKAKGNTYTQGCIKAQ